MTVMRMLNVQICLDPSTAPVQMDILEMERIVPVRNFQLLFKMQVSLDSFLLLHTVELLIMNSHNSEKPLIMNKFYVPLHNLQSIIKKTFEYFHY